MISSIVVLSYGSPSGTLEVRLDSAKLRIDLTEDEAREVVNLAERIYERRQVKLAVEVARPIAALADFTEVVPNNGDYDDVPL